MSEAAYHKEIIAWRLQVEENLRRRDGWLALAGLLWLEPGVLTAGSDPSADLVLPASAPARLGVFELKSGSVTFLPEASLENEVAGAPSSGEPLLADTSGRPHSLHVGEVTLRLIERGGRLALRVWDNARPERTGFTGRKWFPIDPGLRLQASFSSPTESRTILVPDILGGVSEQPDLGTARFSLKGHACSLRAVPADNDLLWFLFEDGTNGDTTYPSGRFLVAEAPVREIIVLDFNRSYNPPCVFTQYATCPLPPEGNRLPIPIEAGEMIPNGV